MGESALPALNGLPTRFETAIGNGLEGYYAVQLNGQRLVWSFGRGTTPQEQTQIVPSRTTWTSFATVLEEIDIFSWAAGYNDPSVRDGTYWHLALTWNDRTVEASGANAFPAEFERFCAGVRTLLGGLANA
jgi:hypothetical protein